MTITPHLIQRCSFKKNITPATATGFDSLVECAYMGSSEFEFGAKPASLRAITKDLSQYQIFGTGLKNKDNEELFLLCKPEDQTELINILNVLKDPSQRTYWLKEGMRLHYSLTETRESRGYNYTDLFWDLENHWLCGFQKDKMELLLQGLKALRQRWLSDGKI